MHQSTLSAEAQGKLGAPQRRRARLLPVVADLGPRLGAGAGGARRRASRSGAASARLGWLLVPAPLLFLAFMGLQGRYFGRWLLPIFPILCLLAAFFALQARAALARRRGRAAAPAPRGAARSAVAVASRAARRSRCSRRALVYSVHSGLVLSRADTRNLTRAWMVAHIPRGRADRGRAGLARRVGARSAGRRRLRRHALPLVQVPVAARCIDARRRARRRAPRTRSAIEDYERTLSPALIGYYERHGYCWVVSGSTESGRAFADPRAVPQAIAYYRALAAQGEVVYRASPYARGAGPGRVQLRLELRLLPARLPPPGPGDDRLPPARRALRALSARPAPAQGYPGCGA